MICIVKTIIAIILAIGILLGGYFYLVYDGVKDNNDNTRDPIPVQKIDWNYMANDANFIRIENVRVYNGNNMFDIMAKTQEFCTLMLNNPEKIYSEERSSSIKVYLRFHKEPSTTMQYTIDKYNGKECTFYVDKSLLSDLEYLQDKKSE